MNEACQNMLQQLFTETSLEAVSRRDMEKIVEQYPYFAPAQFLLAKKLKDSNGNGSEAQLQKAALYFSNPYWYNYLLNHDALKHQDEATIQEAPPIAITTIEEGFPIIAEVDAAAMHTEEEEPEPEDDMEPVSDDDTDIQKMKLSSLIEQHFSAYKKPLQPNEELQIKSSPFHTIDYFASQGIKTDGQDMMTNRVKKFTDWLKQMKGGNSQPNDLGTDAETEQMIETIAQTSNETKEVVTEAMAEVLIKQGKTQKAMQLYKKLSFLNPGKSTYFAAKIDELNNK